LKTFFIKYSLFVDKRKALLKIVFPKTISDAGTVFIQNNLVKTAKYNKT